jgi:hypothetical protein
MKIKTHWKSCRRRIDLICEWQTRFVANNISKSYDPKTDKKYKQSERILKRLGFYDDFGV